MPITPDHSGNLPHEFTVCVDCGKKGVYPIAPQPLRVEDGEISAWRYESWRCKYCGWSSVLGPEGGPRSLGERLGFQPIQSRTHGYNGQEHR